MKKRLYNRFKNSRIDTDRIVVVFCIILALSIISAPVVAQTISQGDNFENGNIDGWDGSNISLSNQSIEGQYSLKASDGTGGSYGRFPSWETGPTLDVNQEFNVTGTSKINQGDNTARSGVGLIEGDSSSGMILLFSGEFGVTFLATDGLEDYSGDQDSYSTSFDDTWVNWEIRSTGNGTVQAKVWEVNTTKPESYKLSRQFNTSSGSFRIWSGTTENGREVYLDSVKLEGTKVDPSLTLETGNYLYYGQSQDYTVYDLRGENEIRYDVTEDTSVNSLNTSIVTVDESTNQLTATQNENVSARVNITATYQGRTDVKQVTVASQTIENLDVLPFLGRVSAMVLDRGFQMILVGLLLSVAATRVGGVYAGLGIYQMSLTAGWLIGWVPIGLALVGLFTTLFIGLNIAANIDYSVRR